MDMSVWWWGFWIGVVATLMFSSIIVVAWCFMIYQGQVRAEERKIHIANGNER